MEYLLRKYDDQPATHVLSESNLPTGEIWQARGYLFVPPDLAAKLGEPDDSVTFGDLSFPAWRLNN